MASKLLEVRDLRTYFRTDEGLVKAVDGVTFDIDAGETVGLVGESGCGKSVTSLSILRLIPEPPGEIAGGDILFRGRSLLGLSEQEMRSIRGNAISMIFQEPMTSLNPVFTCGFQIMEAIQLHQQLGPAAARERAIEMLRVVGIPSPEQRVDEYPHQLSGGMRQRVMIAMALSCNPALLIADEPTTALDVTIQAQILELIARLREEFGMAVLIITHDLGVVAEVSDRVAVMYAGKIVEYASTRSIFKQPVHPYTQGLLASIPTLGLEIERLAVIPGTVPNPLEFPAGCKFHPRCPLADERCRREEPELEPAPGEAGQGPHGVACWKAGEIAFMPRQGAAS
ncbi:MAG: ABC transporter ATP-binding protein [Candidatus Eiseniibacteriota bacterium]|jgi:oligopeptide/dipeptide ABC transporter ATP-binding protein